MTNQSIQQYGYVEFLNNSTDLSTVPSFNIDSLFL